MNRLAQESSPYLRQHATNPVDWQPWGPEAFHEARERDVPILLSIGYSACHWCHVMAHESFEDPAVAEVVNDRFVAIKVDREERPDVDTVYMEAVQAMTGQGGWPLTAFLSPDGRPFFAGTYFPAEPSHGRPSFTQLCLAIDDAWQNKRDDIEEQASRITAHLGQTNLVAGEVPIDATLLSGAVEVLATQHDQEWGGFGSTPKFPQTMALDLLLRHHVRTGDRNALDIATKALDAMAAGGIHDHLGGGFSRYSVDRQWLVPHFEKMLYDQALLARVYLHAWQLTAADRHHRVLDDTIGYVLRILRHPSGGFFAAEDADSEGVEGRFYVWTPDQLREVLGIDAGPVEAWWGVDEAGNFEGASILNRLHGSPEEPEPPLVTDARRRLLEVREDRVRPGLDDKVLTEWNALMITTLAEAGAATGNHLWIQAAVTAAEFLLDNLRNPAGRWLRSWQDDGQGGTAQHLALAADHAALVQAFIALSEATGQARWIQAATATADDMLALFWDDAEGGLHTTGRDGEPLVAQVKDLLDNATPSANSMAAVGLLRLAALTGNPTYRARAEATVAMLASTAAQHPTALGHLLIAVDLLANGIDEVVIPGESAPLILAVQTRYLPGTVLAWGEPYDSPLWEGRSDGVAYVCRDFACQVPTDQPEALVAQLTSTP